MMSGISVKNTPGTSKFRWPEAEVIVARQAVLRYALGKQDARMLLAMLGIDNTVIFDDHPPSYGGMGTQSIDHYSRSAFD